MIKRPLLAGLLVAIIFVPLLILLPRCTHDPVGVELLDTVCFDTQVMPILEGACKKCHDGSQEGFAMGSYTDVMNYVTPGNPRKSKLYQSITRINGGNMMPPDRPLTEENRTIIEVWIAQGAHNKVCKTATGGGGGSVAGETKSCSDSIYFAQKILPLITNSCAWCHNGTSQGGEDVLAPLNSYETIRPYVNPSDPSSSPLYLVLGAGGENQMPPPPNPAVSASDQSMLLTWIGEGAMNNSCTGGTCDTSGTITYTTQILPILQHNCTGCHTPPYNQGGVDLTGYDQVKTLAQTLRPNAPGGTPVLIGVVRRIAGFKSMPTTYALDECSIRAMELWIAQGLKQ